MITYQWCDSCAEETTHEVFDSPTGELAECDICGMLSAPLWHETDAMWDDPELLTDVDAGGWS